MKCDFKIGMAPLCDRLPGVMREIHHVRTNVVASSICIWHYQDVTKFCLIFLVCFPTHQSICIVQCGSSTYPPPTSLRVHTSLTQIGIRNLFLKLYTFLKFSDRKLHLVLYVGEIWTKYHNNMSSKVGNKGNSFVEFEEENKTLRLLLFSQINLLILHQTRLYHLKYADSSSNKYRNQRWNRNIRG